MAIQKEFGLFCRIFETILKYFVEISENFEMNPKKILIHRSKPRNPLVVPVKQKPTQRHKDRKKEDRNRHKE